MPYNEEKSLTVDEVYGATAYVLYLNGIVELTQRTLLAISTLADVQHAQPRTVSSSCRSEALAVGSRKLRLDKLHSVFAPVEAVLDDHGRGTETRREPGRHSSSR